jgi:hypothetical protein
MTKNSPRIYTYKITFEEVPYYYYGVKKEKSFNEEYWGSPKTNKWYWELYTPKKQILQFFDFTDEGWLEAQEIEKRLIKPFYDTDKWCLNESCGGIFSLEVSRKSGLQHKENSTGIFSLTPEQRRELCIKIGLNHKENGTGIFSQTLEERRELGRRSGLKCKERGTGVCGIPPEEQSIRMTKTNLQKWECLETGFVTNAGCLSRYQKARGIDTSKRERIS